MTEKLKMTEEEQLHYLDLYRDDPFALMHIENPCDKALIKSLENKGSKEPVIEVIRTRKSVSEEVQLAFIRKDPWSLFYFDDQYETVQMEAIDSMCNKDQNGWFRDARMINEFFDTYVKNPTKKVKQKMFAYKIKRNSSELDF